MKKICLLLMLLPILGVAQQSELIIKVSGYAVHLDSTPIFKAVMSLGGAYSSFPSEVVNLEEMKTRYREVLEKEGISWDSLKENPYDFGYETLGHEKEGEIYEYTTSSISEMKKFLGIKSFGVQRLRYVSKFTIDTNEAKKLSEIALANAKEKASATAAAMGRELGEIREVEDLNNRWGEEVETSLYYDMPAAEYKYFVTVIFNVN